MMNNYWTCSKFADWLRGTMKPGSATSQGWNSWRKEAKKAHPIRYWLAEEGLDHIQKAVYWPYERLNDIRYYANNRWIHRTHLLDGKLTPGQWHEFQERVLHCNFESFVDFVEVEQAWHHVMWSEEARAKYDVPWWRKTNLLRWGKWRCPKAALDYLDWASNLKHDEISSSDPDYGKPTPQAMAAMETVSLYHWWKDIRPLRKDPSDESGWSALCAERREKRKAAADPDEDDDFFSMLDDKTPADRAESSRILKLSNELEEAQNAEDDEMLCRLMKLRRSLWT